MQIKRFLPLCLLAMLLLSSICQAEENMQFVDADGGTGYYVDVNSIAFSEVTETVYPNPIPSADPAKPPVILPPQEETREIITARIAIVKAYTNRRYLQYVKFDPARSEYQVLASKTQQYDTRKQLEKSDT
ncbi:hypothetical protein, partial [Selenomonas sp.]|uniref:hypothetical protein n=1 Tax=Selenomonas sp. TaxID=2053611 RepID=UPI0025F8687B